MVHNVIRRQARGFFLVLCILWCNAGYGMVVPPVHLVHTVPAAVNFIRSTGNCLPDRTWAVFDWDNTISLHNGENLPLHDGDSTRTNLAMLQGYNYHLFVLTARINSFTFGQYNPAFYQYHSNSMDAAVEQIFFADAPSPRIFLQGPYPLPGPGAVNLTYTLTAVAHGTHNEEANWTIISRPGDVLPRIAFAGYFNGPASLNLTTGGTANVNITSNLPAGLHGVKGLFLAQLIAGLPNGMGGPGVRPQCIFFVDDSSSNLQDVHAALAAMGDIRLYLIRMGL